MARSTKTKSKTPKKPRETMASVKAQLAKALSILRKITDTVPPRPRAIEGEINLGDRVRSKISGFTGVVEAMSVWINGCVRCQVAADLVNKDGAELDGRNFDIQELELIEKKILAPMVSFAYPQFPTVMISAPTEPRRLAAPGGPDREAADFDPR